MGVDDLLREADALLSALPDDVTLIVPYEYVGEFYEIRSATRALVTRGICGGLNVDPAFAHFVHDAPHLLREMRDALRAMTGETT